MNGIFCLFLLSVRCITDVHICLYLIPRDKETGTVCAEYRRGWVAQIRFWIIWMCLYDLFLVVTRHVAAEAYLKLALSFRKCAYMKLVIPQRCNWSVSAYDCTVAKLFRCLHDRIHRLQVCHGVSNHRSRYFQCKIIFRF